MTPTISSRPCGRATMGSTVTPSSARLGRRAATAATISREGRAHRLPRRPGARRTPPTSHLWRDVGRVDLHRHREADAAAAHQHARLGAARATAVRATGMRKAASSAFDFHLGRAACARSASARFDDQARALERPGVAGARAGRAPAAAGAGCGRRRTRCANASTAGSGVRKYGNAAPAAAAPRASAHLRLAHPAGEHAAWSTRARASITRARRPRRLRSSPAASGSPARRRRRGRRGRRRTAAR